MIQMSKNLTVQESTIFEKVVNNISSIALEVIVIHHNSKPYQKLKCCVRRNPFQTEVVMDFVSMLISSSLSTGSSGVWRTLI